MRLLDLLTSIAYIFIFVEIVTGILTNWNETTMLLVAEFVGGMLLCMLIGRLTVSR